ncbi:hypothetical protein Tco_0329155 [Tanacetum coccineum]
MLFIQTTPRGRSLVSIAVYYEARPDPGISRVALAGPDPEPFMADLYPKVQESLKFSADEPFILEDPSSSTETLLSMKNLEDAYAIGDHFINDKSTDDKPGKLNVEVEVVSMVNVLIYQASSSIPLLLTMQTNKNLDNTTRNLGSRVYTLELRDLPHKINEVVCENVKEAVQISLHAPLRDRFRDLSKEDMKEMLHQSMFETGFYKSLPEHIALYEALEASMERPKAPQSSAWKKSNTRDAPSSSSKQQSSPLAEQPVDDIPIQDSDNITYSEDTDSTHLPKTKQKPEWLKPTPDNERPATPEPTWVIPTSYIPDAVNNWANALATTYQAPAENSLLEKTGDMRKFMNWYCQKIGKTELTQADLEGQAYEVVKPFYSASLIFSFRWKSVTRCLQIRLTGLIQKGSGQALSISKMKDARYHDFVLELLILEHMWIDDVCTYDISASYGHLNHLPGLDIRMLSTAVKLDATGFKFKHDYTIIDSPHAVVFPVSNNKRKIMRFNEIYKFSDGTLTNIMEALDYRVKEYKVNWLNPSMNMRFWTDKDVERSKEFIHAIERRLKARRIFWNLECFVSGRVRDIDYRLLQRTE